MYKDSSCRSSPQPPPTTNVAEVASDSASTALPTSHLQNRPQQQQQQQSSYPPLQFSYAYSQATVEDDEENGFSCPSESSSEAEYEIRSRISTASTTSTSSSSVAAATAVGAPRPRLQRRLTGSVPDHSHAHVNSDIHLLRKIGHIAARVRFLSKLYGDFKLVNPYSPAKQRRLLQEIILKHSIIDPEREGNRVEVKLRSGTSGNGSLRSSTPASSVASSYCCLPQTAESSFDDDSVTSTVRRKSSTPITATGSIVLLEDLLIQLYEDRRNKVTVIRKRYSRRNSAGGALALTKIPRNHLIIMSSKTASSSVERLLQLDNEEDGGVNGVSGSPSTDKLPKVGTYLINATASSHLQQHVQQRTSNAFLQPIPGDDNLRRRRASDCSTHIGQTLSNQLQITLKNNNCTKLPLHRGSCGAAGEHLLAANSIANRQTLILSKSCSNVDASTGQSNAAFYASSDLRTITGAIAATGSCGGSSSIGTATTSAGIGAATGGNGIGNANGNNEYSIVQLNNTIIQCHFNDDDFRALIKDLKRKIEYTERLNWLCLSKRPMGPPHRKSSLPKHQEVKKRFLEICDTTLSEEVRNALRLPAFDSYEWSDADIIHLMQTMFTELGFIEKFNIPIDILREWLYEVYKHYNEVPFHNFRHCFCVAQMMYAITRQANLLQRLGDLECLILLVSCICHDLDHPGYNNIYQINARTELALRYNDISPLENHHCSIAFRLLEHPDCNIFKNFNRETFNQIREGIIRCILATDMARHNEILTQFKDITSTFDYTNRAHINLLCMILIKVADISNEARPMDVAEPWLDRLLQEFFAQSAAEKSEGLPVTPFMDPDKISKPGSQVRFIGLVLLPLFEALGDLVPEVTELIIIPVRIAFDYYKRLNDAQTKSRKSMADTSSAGPSGDNSGASDNKDNSNSSATVGGGMANGADTTASAPSVGNSGGSISPQMPRSQSGISVKSRRSIPSQKSASRTSVDEPGGIPAELHDLPEGSESGDSETATEVDVAEKTSKFKVDTEGSSNRSKSSHSTSRKSSREKRPSMIGEMCSSGQRIRNSYGNIHGYHANRGHFSSNRAVSLDQYSTNNRRSSDGLQQVISDSNVFYNRHNRSSLEASTVICRLAEDMNMNQQISTANGNTNHTLSDTSQLVPNLEGSISDSTTGSNVTTAVNNVAQPASLTLQTTITATANQHNIINMSTMSSNGNMSPTQILQPRQHICTTGTSVAANNTLNGVTGPHSTEITAPPKSSWKARLKQFSEYFSFSFDKSSKRFGSTRSSPCSMRNNSTAHAATITGPRSGTYVDPLTGKPTGICCTISNNLQSPSLRQTQLVQHQQDLIAAAAAGRHRAYSLDVPCNRSNPRYSSSSGGGGDSSRKSSRHDGGGLGDVNNSNNTLHSSSGTGSEMPTCMPPPIRIGSVDASDTILITTGGLSSVLTPTNLGDAAEPSLSIDLGSSATEPPKI